MGCAFTVEPPVDEAARMKSWFDSIKDRELANLLGDQTVPISRERFNSGAMRLHTVEELEEEKTCGDFWIRGSLQISDEDQHFFYMACSHCFSTINIVEEGFHYPCWVCKKEAITVVRLIVHMDVADATGTMVVSAIDDVAQQILQTTHADFARSRRMGNQYEVDSRRIFFMDKQFAMLLRRTHGKKYDGKRKMLLVDYHMEAVIEDQPVEPPVESHGISNAVPTESSSENMSNENGKGKASETVVSPLKRLTCDEKMPSGSPAKRHLKVSEFETLQGHQKVD